MRVAVAGGAAAVALGAAAIPFACFRAEPAPYAPRDPHLAAWPLYVYPAVTTPARAFVFFVGNDIGFWGAHQELAKRLAGAGYHVVGIDVKAYFPHLVDADSARGRAFADTVAMMIGLARRELGADSLPVIVGGHSLGAEIAAWIAAEAPPRDLAGALLISPRARGHLRATLSDVANRSAPEEPGSFGVGAEIAAAAPGVRFAIVRGTDDRFRDADAGLLRAGGQRIEKWAVPWGGHSMSNILLAGPFVERALAWTLRR